MIGVLTGTVLFSDGQEALIQTASGVGYQAYCSYIFPEGELTCVYVAHIIRESAEVLFAFRTLREKKLFELMTTVKGVGPKSAYNIVSKVSLDQIIMAVKTEQKSILTTVSGVGTKAASQIILDLSKKIHKIKMYSIAPLSFKLKTLKKERVFSNGDLVTTKLEKIKMSVDSDRILNDTVLACENLGFQTEKVIPLAQRILKENTIKKVEQLVHLVLKEI